MSELRGCKFRLFLIVVVCLALPLAVWAQTSTGGSIAGTVTDQTGAVVPNAAITVRNADTNIEKSTSSNAEGQFRLVGLTPGAYSVAAKAPSFAPFKADRVVVEVGLVSTLEVRLGVAGKLETVEVTGEAAMVNTVQADFANNINQAAIENLPINGRRWSNFAMLAPGAALDGTYGLISFRGMTGLMNNSTIDGGDNNQAFFAEERGRTRASYVVSQASVREFQVNTSNYSAEYGRAAGAVVNTVTKTGTNTLHGLVFYNIRDNALGAYNPLTTRTVKDPSTGLYVTSPYKPEDRRQQFGGNLGGPIKKDKLFFFFNYDGQRWNMPGVAAPNTPSTLFAVPSSSELKTLAQRMNNLSSSATPSAAQLASATTAFNAGLDFLQATTGTQPRHFPQDIFFPRLDWNISRNNTFFVSYNRMRRSALAGVQSPAVVNRGVNDWGDDFVKVDIVNARLSSVLSNTVSNELRFSWGRDFEFQLSTPGMNPVEKTVAALAKTPSYGGYLPETYITAGGFQFGRPYYTERWAYPDEHRDQVANSTSWSYGKHLIKFGADVSKVNDLMNHVNRGGGAYTFSNRVDFITDYTQVMSGASWKGAANAKNYYYLNQGMGPSKWEFNTWDFAFFVQDDFRVLPRLTVNLGVRYEYQQLPSPQIPNPALPLTQSMPSDKNNIGPRVGFAWDVLGNGKTALRGGYGIYYARLINSTIASALNGTGLADSAGNPLGQVNYYVQTSTTGAPVWPNVLAGAVKVPPDLAMYGHGVQNPQIHQADLILEHEFAHNTVLSVSYLLSLGRQLVNVVDSNLAPQTTPITYTFNGGPFNGESVVVPVYSYPSTGSARPNTAYGKITQVLSNLNSNYNALVVQVNRRMTTGLQFQSSYTWAHALDWGTSSFTFTDQNSNKAFDIYNNQYEYGNSTFDIRHRFIGSVVWQPQRFKDSGPATKALLSGWTIAPIFAFTSGRPYTEATSGNPTMPSGVRYVLSGFNASGGPNRLAPLVGRNNWRMPWLQNIDLRVARSIHIAERHNLELIAEAFNLFNHKNVFYVQSTMYRMCSNSSTPSCSATSTQTATTVPANTWLYDSTFGNVTGADSTLYRERQIQFGVRYTF